MSTMYEVLGIAAGAEPGQVKTAYRALAKRCHPDVNFADVTAEGRFKDISEAYEILRDSERRAAYNLGLKHKHAETHRRVRNAMATTAVSFMITVGCGLYFLPSAPSAHEPWTTSVATEASSPPPTPPERQAKSEQTTRPDVELTPAARPSDERRMKIAEVGAVVRSPPQLDPETQREQALHLHAKGMERIGQGNVLAARSFFALAAKAGLKRSMRALAGTYDPVQLGKLKVLGLQPDVDAARMWYEKAGDLAAATAWPSQRDAVAELGGE